MGARDDLVLIHVPDVLRAVRRSEADVVRRRVRPASAADRVVVEAALHHRVLEREAGPAQRVLAENDDVYELEVTFCIVINPFR